MQDAQVIPFAPAFQRRRDSQQARTAYARRMGPWRNRYAAGIDGLWVGPQRAASGASAAIIRFVPQRS